MCNTDANGMRDAQFRNEATESAPGPTCSDDATPVPALSCVHASAAGVFAAGSRVFSLEMAAWDQAAVNWSRKAVSSNSAGRASA